MQVQDGYFQKKANSGGIGVFILSPIRVREVEGGNPRQDCMSLSWGLFLLQQQVALRHDGISHCTFLPGIVTSALCSYNQACFQP